MTDDGNVRADVLTEFLEVAIHTILYVRGIYPKEIFVLRKKYQIPVHVSKHPKVNAYINECLKTIRQLLRSDSVKDVSVAILKDRNIVEKFVFDVRLTGGDASRDYLVNVEEVFRQFALKLAVSDSVLEPLPTGECTFDVRITTSERCYVRLNEHPDSRDFPWIQAEGDRDEDDFRRIVPVKSARTALFSLNVYVER